jgi:2-dehydro-3-deoxy-D-gluconate 5-dehydrogenase
VIANRFRKEGIAAAEELKGKGFKAVAVATDISVKESVKRMVEATVATFGGVDILVNNAGIYPMKPVLSMSVADFDKVIAVNLKGVFLCMKYVSEKMIQQKRGGRIINITSIDALHPTSVGLAHYDASKHGVWGFTNNTALELAPHNIWVNAIAPGGIMTPGVKKLQQKGMVPNGVGIKETIEAMTKRIPMQRFGDPDDIGKVVLFLASGMASYMTGEQIVVDGGVLLA